MNTKLNKTETGVSLDRETVINKLLPMFKNWNDETHEENDCSRGWVSESAKWDTEEGYFDGESILNDIIKGKDIDEVLEQNLPQHSTRFSDYEYTMEDEMMEDIESVSVSWEEWKNTDSYEQIHTLLSEYQKDPKNQLKSLFKQWNSETHHERTEDRLDYKFPVYTPEWEPTVEDIEKMIGRVQQGDDLEQVLSDYCPGTTQIEEYWDDFCSTVMSKMDELDVWELDNWKNDSKTYKKIHKLLSQIQHDQKKVA